MNSAYEVNFDGIVGPTHNYSGLSYGNIASQTNQYSLSNPREAALQGLAKMYFLAKLGIKQAVLPPHERPHIPTLRALGFRGSDSQIMTLAYKEAPELLTACSSAAAMWTANAATVSPSMDSSDACVHFTAANLSNKFHRAIESPLTERLLKKIFNSSDYFVHHPPLPAGNYFSDEGAANHSRFCRSHAEAGVQAFIFGRHAFGGNSFSSKRFPARQTKEASQALARRHLLSPERCVFIQQHPLAIDAGAFHNDVVAVANQNVFFFHEQAFLNKESTLSEIQEKVAAACNCEMIFLEVRTQDISLARAVETYLFNSQLITLNAAEMILIAPAECQKDREVADYLNSLVQSPENPIMHMHTFDLQQSMRNGGGPACLRLRIVLTEKELSMAHPFIFLDDSLYVRLKAWIEKHYRDRLALEDLADPQLINEGRYALDELTQLLQLGSLYDFQTASDIKNS